VFFFGSLTYVLQFHTKKRAECLIKSCGTPVTKFSLAVNRTYKTPTGERKEETEWFNIVAWRQLAELTDRYLHKGSKAYVEGRLTQRKYTDKQGVQRIAVEIIASGVEFLDSPKPVSG
jgi:single-strand DNA-binding protein